MFAAYNIYLYGIVDVSLKVTLSFLMTQLKITDYKFNNFWYIRSWGNLTLEKYPHIHLQTVAALPW